MRKLSFLSAAIAICLLSGPVFGQEVTAITRPSEDVTLRMVKPGRIAKMAVKEGEEVKAGQLLVQQDDAAERVNMEQLKSKADDDVRIRAAEAQLEQKKVEYDKLKEAYEKKAVSKWDVEHARLEVVMGQLSLELAKFEHSQDRQKYEEQRIQVERMRLESPISGKVEKTFLKTGESSDPQADVIRIVRVDPLWIEVPVPLAEGRTLKVGGPAWVRFMDNSGIIGNGKIVLVAAVADAASDTLTVRVELPNPAERPAGEHVTVRFK